MNKRTSNITFASMVKIQKAVLLVISVFLLNNISANAQEFVKIKRGKFKIDEHETGFKSAWKSIKTANKLMEEGVGSYREARGLYLDAYKYNDGCAELNYMIGFCYIYTDNKYQAIKYLEEAYELNPEVSVDIYYLLARANHLTYNFDEAIEFYNQYKAELHPKVLPGRIGVIGQHIKECQNGINLIKQPQRVVIQLADEGINSEYDDYYPVVNTKDTIMYFTSRRPRTIKDKTFQVDNKYYEDVYVSVKDSNKWSYALKLNRKLAGRKNASNLAAVALSNNAKRLYLYKGDKSGGDLFKATFREGKWRKAKSINNKFNSNEKESALCFSSNEKEMYLVSEKDKNSFGNADIFFAYKNLNGKWEKPVNIGPKINTDRNEISIALSSNDSILYFTSNGHNTMGGFDIFKSERNPDGTWSAPDNLGYPINTPDDDIFYIPVGNGKSAYYSSIREKGIGGKDIYKIIYLGAEKELKTTGEDDLIAGLKYPNRIRVLPPIMDIDTSIILKGRVLDKKTNEPISGKLEVIDSEKSKIVATAISDNFGMYEIKISEPKVFGVEIMAQGYMFFLDVVDLSMVTFSDVVERDFLLDKVEVGAKVVLRNIYFETGKSTLKEESYAELTNVVKLLEGNPSLTIEISGHTDNVGSAKSNIKLSDDRAKSVVDYLVSQGIEKARLQYKGYGFSEPIAPNNTAEGRAKNRRVEFKILSK